MISVGASSYAIDAAANVVIAIWKGSRIDTSGIITFRHIYKQNLAAGRSVKWLIILS